MVHMCGAPFEVNIFSVSALSTSIYCSAFINIHADAILSGL